MRPGKLRLNQAWINGLVVESTKYGNPTVAVRSKRMRAVGAELSAGFHDVAGCNRQHGDRRQQEQTLGNGLAARRKAADQQVTVGITAEKHDLKEQHAGRPDRRAPPNQGRMNLLMSGWT